MMKIGLLLVILSVIGSACSKELAQNVSQEEQPQIAVILTDSTGPNDGGANEAPGNDDSDDISESPENVHDVYSFMGVSGTYFGCSSTFKSKKETLEFIFGTNLTPNLTYTQEEFEALIHPGERSFGSLGAFTTFPERTSNRVEIAFTDTKGRRWSSTRITELNHGQSVQTSVAIEQPRGFFVLDEAHKFEIAAETEGYRLKGRFECTLYEVNGKAKKNIKGNFTGVVAPK
jgi:hypothetical protein